MSKRTVVDCDRCERKDIFFARKTFVVTNEGKESIEMCPHCLALEINRVLKTLTPTAGTSWLEAIRRRKAKQALVVAVEEEEEADATEDSPVFVQAFDAQESCAGAVNTIEIQST